MSHRAANAGMSRGVQRALGLVEVGTEQVALCTCGGERIVTTDHAIFMRGLARLGRMIDYCTRCNGIMRIYAGPKMLTREDKDAEYELFTNRAGVVTRRLKRAANDRAERNRRSRGHSADNGHGG